MSAELIDVPEQEALEALARERREEYAAADPFPHAVFDDLFPAPLVDGLVEEYAATEAREGWDEVDEPLQVKMTLDDERRMGPRTRAFVRYMNSRCFLAFLEELTGIEGLIPDPNLEGGGYHRIRAGGLLKVHADFNKHVLTGLDRRLNAILYLNHDWEESYGGHLELWDTEMTRCAKRVLPVKNRLVVFSTTDFSFHGHPDALSCPPDRARRSIALYYYSNGRPASEVRQEGEEHTTIFRRRPGEDARAFSGTRAKLQRLRGLARRGFSAVMEILRG